MPIYLKQKIGKLSLQTIQQNWLPIFWLTGSEYSESTIDNSGILKENYVEPLEQGYLTEIEEFIKMGNSVLKNGGFYVGRYELGTEIPRNSETDKATKPLSKPSVYPYNFLYWGKSNSDTGKVYTDTLGAVELCKNMYSEEYSVCSTLIYGRQWDSILDWIKDKRNVSNSSAWGNHRGSVYTIPKGLEIYELDKEWKVAETDIIKDSTTQGYLFKTGEFSKINSESVVNNIYDLAGNEWEWTMESVKGLSRALRGGALSQAMAQVSSRTNTTNSGVEVAFADRGARVILYIK